MNSHLDAAVASIKSEIARLSEVLAALENGAATPKAATRISTTPAPIATEETTPSATPKTKKRRGRRPSADLKQQAQDMADFIQAKGKAGATSTELVRQFGKVLPSIKAFITSKVDAKLKTHGAGSATYYVIE